jgi:hypothetical protein
MAEVRGYSGSIGLMWNRRNIKIHLIKIDFHFLHVQVKEKDMDPWLLTMVYTSPRENKISETCHQSQILATIITDPWLVMGDFKCFPECNLITIPLLCFLKGILTLQEIIPLDLKRLGLLMTIFNCFFKKIGQGEEILCFF